MFEMPYHQCTIMNIDERCGEEIIRPDGRMFRIVCCDTFRPHPIRCFITDMNTSKPSPSSES